MLCTLLSTCLHFAVYLDGTISREYACDVLQSLHSDKNATQQSACVTVCSKGKKGETLLKV